MKALRISAIVNKQKATSYTSSLFIYLKDASKRRLAKWRWERDAPPRQLPPLFIVLVLIVNPSPTSWELPLHKGAFSSEHLKKHLRLPKIICDSKEFLGRGATDYKVLPFDFRQKVDKKSCCDEVIPVDCPFQKRSIAPFISPSRVVFKGLDASKRRLALRDKTR